MNYWLMKTEPSVFSFDDLAKAPLKTTDWEGVRNYQARNFMRDKIKNGDKVLIYHSNAEPTAVVGIAEVMGEGRPDPSAINPTSPYFDASAVKRGQNPWVVVSVRAVFKFKTPVTREDLKNQVALTSMMVLRKGARLSVQPVTPEEFRIVESLGNRE